MKTLISILITLSIAINQSDNIRLIKSIEGDFNAIKVDELGNMLVTNRKKHLIKLSPKLDTMFVFSEKNSEVNQFQVQNALKILVFNESLNTIQYLDKTLSHTSGDISLDAAQVKLSSALGVSRDNNFWVYDENEQMLKKFNINLNEISSSGSLLNITGKSWFPQSLYEMDNKVFVIDSIKGIMEFDFFGNFLSQYNTMITGTLKTNKSQFLYIKNDTLIIQDKVLSTRKKIPLPVENIIDFDFSKEKLYLLNKEKLYIYQLSF